MPLLIELAVEPRSRGDAERLDEVLRRLVAEDAGFGVSQDGETRQIIVKGQSEQHLEAVVDRIERECPINVGAPQVAYRETLGRKVEIDYTHKELRAAGGRFARVKLVFEPGEPGSDYSFESRIVGGSVPKEYIPGVEKGLEASRHAGVLAGFPVIDFKATLVDGAYHDVDSSLLAFEIAASEALKEGLMKAQCLLLEPVMRIEVVTPEDCLGEVIGDLNSRRGQIRRIEALGNAQVINAMVPLANMFGYDLSLKMLSQKRGTFRLVFDHYAPLPMPPGGDDPSAPAVALRG